MSIKSVQYPNKVTGDLYIDPDRIDTTKFGVYSTGTEQQFEIGTRYGSDGPDDRAFRYAKALTELNPQRGAFDPGVFLAETLTLATAVGDMFVTITTGALSGSLTLGFGTENNMVGGYLSIPMGACKQVRRITGHVAAPSGTIVKVYLDGPITLISAIGQMLECCPNPYRNMSQPGGTNTAVMGVPTTLIAAGSFGWLQTWGPTWMAPNAILDFGAAYDQMARFHEGGNLEDANNHANSQLAGFIMGRRALGNWANPPFIFLTITR